MKNGFYMNLGGEVFEVYEDSYDWDRGLQSYITNDSGQACEVNLFIKDMLSRCTYIGPSSRKKIIKKPLRAPLKVKW